MFSGLVIKIHTELELVAHVRHLSILEVLLKLKKISITLFNIIREE